MRVELIAAVSIDGFIARHTDELVDWTSQEDKQFFVQETKRLGVIVMGRTTFETIGRALPGRRMIVLTRSPSKYQVEGIEFTTETPHELVTRLASEGVTSLAVCGGAHVYTDFLEAGLVDQVLLTVEDIRLKDGLHLTTKPLSGELTLNYSQYLSEKTSVQAFSYTPKD